MMRSSLLHTWRKRLHDATWNGTMGFLLLATSDYIAQKYEFGHASFQSSHPSGEKINDVQSFEIDGRRFLTAGFVGIFVGGFVYPTAYAKLDSIFQGRQIKQIVQKSLVEIFTVGVFVNSLSLFSRGMLVGRSADCVASHVVSEMP